MPTAVTAAKQKKINLEIIKGEAGFGFEEKQPISWKHSKAPYKCNQRTKLSTLKNAILFHR